MSERIICSNCCMDKSASEITFDGDGVCNFCHQIKKSLKEIALEKPNLDKWIKQIKKDGKGKRYDCLIGLSGGVDSSTVLHLAIKFGLRPLCWAIDNGYNDPRADANVMKLVEGMRVPFEKHNINAGNFRGMQGAFLQAGVPNIEIPTDHILMAKTYELASKYGIKWVLSGGNVASEGVMPPSWGYNARDLTHIKDIYKGSLKGLPVCGLLKFNYYKWIKRIEIFYPLDYLEYDRIGSEKLLEKEYNYISTGGKHEENYFTKWFQNYYLFEKFGFDKRKAHYSSLINSGQMSKKDAMEALTKRPEFPILNIEEQAMSYPRRQHNEFKNDEKLWKLLVYLIRALRKPYRILTKIIKN